MLLFVLVFNFFLFRIVPGDPASLLARNKLLPPAMVQEVRQELGLDKPLGAQFVVYVKATLRGDLGISYTYRVPVSTLILKRIWATAVLAGSATLLATVAGLLIGVYGAWHSGSAFDLTSLSLSLAAYAAPSFWIGILLLMLFASWLPLFPTGGLATPGVALSGGGMLLDRMNHLVLPALAFALGLLGPYALTMRASLIEVMGEEYLTTARAKGLPEETVLWRHAVPNALLPTVTLLGLNLGFVVAGTVMIETVFSWPGLGLLTYDALRAPDYPLLEGLFLLFSASVIGANLLADLSYYYLDPRVGTA